MFITITISTVNCGLHDFPSARMRSPKLPSTAPSPAQRRALGPSLVLVFTREKLIAVEMRHTRN